MDIALQKKYCKGGSYFLSETVYYLDVHWMYSLGYSR